MAGIGGAEGPADTQARGPLVFTILVLCLLTDSFGRRTPESEAQADVRHFCVPSVPSLHLAHPKCSVNICGFHGWLNE